MNLETDARASALILERSCAEYQILDGSGVDARDGIMRRDTVLANRTVPSVSTETVDSVVDESQGDSVESILRDLRDDHIFVDLLSRRRNDERFELLDTTESELLGVPCLSHT